MGAVSGNFIGSRGWQGQNSGLLLAVTPAVALKFIERQGDFLGERSKSKLARMS